MHLSKVIEQLGYPPNQVKVYLAALQLGECTVSDLAERVKMPRTSVQVIVDALHGHGLMNFFAKRRYRYWVAENPERLLITLEEREAALRAVMPELSAMRSIAGARPTVKVFGGAEEIKRIHDDIIAAQRHILAIISWDDWVELLGTEYMEDFIGRRVQHFLQIRILAPRTDHEIELRSRDAQERRQARFLPDHIRIKTTNFIYGTKIAMVSFNNKLPTGIVIDDADIAETMTAYFEELWKQSR